MKYYICTYRLAKIKKNETAKRKKLITKCFLTFLLAFLVGFGIYFLARAVTKTGENGSKNSNSNSEVLDDGDDVNDGDDAITYRF